jgi:hypothetical protein
MTIQPSELGNRVWDGVQPSLKAIVKKVCAHNPSTQARIDRLTTDVFPLKASAFFNTFPRDPNTNEDLVIQTVCRSTAATLECYTDICDGIASFLLEGPKILLDINRDRARVLHDLDEWIVATREFIRQHEELALRILSPGSATGP